MIDKHPLVTVNILSFNRKDELRNTLTKVFEQDYKNIEVIVVDNASTDGSTEMVKKEFPSVQLIIMGKNIGIAGWNEGFKVAKGEYVLVLDDDSYPKENHLIKNSINQFSDNSVGVLAFRVWNTKKMTFENNNFVINTSPDFIGCGAMIKLSLTRNIGYFNDLLFIYNHELDFSIRVYNNRFKISFLSNEIIIHNSSAVNRSTERRKYYMIRNYLIILFLYFNINKVLFRMIKIAIGRLYSGIKQGNFYSILNGIISFLILIPKLSKHRKPVNLNVQKLFGFGNFAGGFHFNECDWSN